MCKIILAVSVITGNATMFTSPWLIFHDEIGSLQTLGSNIKRDLACQSDTAYPTGWHLTSGELILKILVPTALYSYSQSPFIQITTSPNIARLARIFPSRPDYTYANGLFTCRLNGIEEGSIPIGIYQRGEGM